MARHYSEAFGAVASAREIVGEAAQRGLSLTDYLLTAYDECWANTSEYRQVTDAELEDWARQILAEAAEDIADDLASEMSSLEPWELEYLADCIRSHMRRHARLRI